MTRSRVLSPQAVKVLNALADQPSQWRYGYDLAVELGLKSGSLYPMLIRLADRELLEADWEPGAPGKPPRHIYRITSSGLTTVSRLATESAEPQPRLTRNRLQGA